MHASYRSFSLSVVVSQSPPPSCCSQSLFPRTSKGLGKGECRKGREGQRQGLLSLSPVGGFLEHIHSDNCEEGLNPSMLKISMQDTIRQMHPPIQSICHVMRVRKYQWLRCREGSLECMKFIQLFDHTVIRKYACNCLAFVLSCVRVLQRAL